MKILSVVFVTVLASALNPAHAASVEDVRQQAVSFADLDLHEQAGAERLYLRIRAAAREVCETPGVMEVLSITRARRCTKDATARAVADVNAPSLTRYYAEHGGFAYRGNSRGLLVQDDVAAASGD